MALNPKLIYPIKGSELNIGDTCERGSQLRPNIVWFGEAVPMMEVAADVAANAQLAGTHLDGILRHRTNGPSPARAIPARLDAAGDVSRTKLAP